MLSSSLKLFAVFALAGAFALPAFAYTSPGNPSGYVNDFAGVLSSETKTQLEDALTEFHRTTGGDIAVAIVKSLGGDDIETYSNTLFREWGVGNKSNDTGILLVVATEDKKVRIEVGYGYEGVVTDLYSNRIIEDDITPYFKQGNYDDGVRGGVTGLISLIENPNSEAPTAPPDSSSFSFGDIRFYLSAFFFFIIWLGSILARSKSWWGGGIVGGVVAVVLYFIFGLTVALFSALPLIGFGLLFDYIVSNAYTNARSSGRIPPWWIGGGGFGGGSGGGFGGFGGGSSGGGGASGSW